MKALSAVLIPNGPLSDCMPSETIPSANVKVSVLVHHDTGNNSTNLNTTQGQYSIVSSQRKTIAPPSRANVYPGALGFQILGQVHVHVDMLNYRGMTAMLHCPAPTSHTVFVKMAFTKSNFFIHSQNIACKVLIKRCSTL